MAQVLEGLGHEVVVAGPNVLPMYGSRNCRVTTDERDVTALAEGGAPARLMIPPASTDAESSAVERQHQGHITKAGPMT